MAGPNTAGTPKTSDYNLGRGVLYLAILDPSTGKPDADGYRDLGNSPEFTVTVTEETLQHFSSREGTKTLDTEITLTQQIQGSFQLDELSDENHALLLNATQATLTNPAKTMQAKFTMVTGVKLGRWYDLVTAAGVRLYDVASANLTFEKGMTLLVLGTDYLLDEKMGRIFLLSTAANITTGENLDMTVAADAGAVDVAEVRALQDVESTFALKFISKNPNDNNAQREYQFHQVRIKANGDLSAIGDDWTTLPYSFSAERNEKASTTSPVLTIRTHANA